MIRRATAPQPGQRGGSARSATKRSRRSERQPHAPLSRARRAAAQAARVSDPRNLRPRRAPPAPRPRRSRISPSTISCARRMLEGIDERLGSVTRSFRDVLDLGCFDGGFAAPPGATVTRRRRRRRASRARLAASRPTRTACRSPTRSFDLIVSAGVLDSVNDLPGALALARRALRPDGLFLAAFTGGRIARHAARGVPRRPSADRPAARIPSAGRRALGGRPARARRLRAARRRRRDAHGALCRPRPVCSTICAAWRRATCCAIAARCGAIRWRALPRPSPRMPMPMGGPRSSSSIVYLTGWAPSSDQPRPARRGSATTSLAAALSRNPLGSTP